MDEKIDKNKRELALIDFNKLFNGALGNYTFSRKIYYTSKLHFNPETKNKSTELIKTQRKLRNKLISQGYEFIIAGNVRAQKGYLTHSGARIRI